MEAARYMISHAGKAVATAAYVHNCTITTATNKSPYERWYGSQPYVTNLRVFYCIACVHVPDATRYKLNKKAEKMRFVGCNSQPKGYRLLNENIGRVVIQCDVIFNESDFGNLNEADIVRSEDTVVIETAPGEQNKVSQSKEVCQHPVQQVKPPVRYGVGEYVDKALYVLKDQACLAYSAVKYWSQQSWKKPWQEIMLQSGSKLLTWYMTH